MHRDIDRLLRDWDAQHGVTQARLIDARNGRTVLQVRLDLGILQLEIDGRPDGTVRTASRPISNTCGI